MFNKVCIIGCGLIGSSIARAIKKNNLANKIVSSNRSDITNNKVMLDSLKNNIANNSKKNIKNSLIVNKIKNKINILEKRQSKNWNLRTIQ